MYSIKTLGLATLLVFAVGCSDGNSGAPAPLALNFTEAPIDLSGSPANYAEDVVYGPKERNVFDIYLPDCDDPTPLVIFIHGGGFTGGDKDSASEEQIIPFLQSCIAHASINYTLLTIPSEEEGTASAVSQGGVLTSLQDAARALQFMRHHAKSLNIEPENVALYGGSAGAGASLWLGTHDDMADPLSSDPVLRQSTRVKAVGAIATQATYDLLLWEEILLPVVEPYADFLGGTDIPTIAEGIGAANYLLTFLGVATVEDIFTEVNQDYRSNVDLLGLMDAGDAPIFVLNPDTGFGVDPAGLLNMFLHHGLHALAVRDRALEVGLHHVAYVRGHSDEYNLEDPSGEDLVSFLSRHIL